MVRRASRVDTLAITQWRRSKTRDSYDEPTAEPMNANTRVRCVACKMVKTVRDFGHSVAAEE